MKYFCYDQLFVSVQISLIHTEVVLHSENRTNIKLNIYYKNKKLRHLILRSNNNRKSDSRVAYQYTYKEATCNGASYIGYTACALQVRFYSHVQNGSIQRHNRLVHNTQLFTRQFLETTKNHLPIYLNTGT